LNLIRVMPAKGQDISVPISIRLAHSFAQSAAGSAAARSHRYVLETGANQ
jgi:hypothetical protein